MVSLSDRRDEAEQIFQKNIISKKARAGERSNRIGCRPAETLALALNDFTNNTSLAWRLSLSIQVKCCSFPGDAQVGSWLSWADLSWTVTDRMGHARCAGADLFPRIVFYKDRITPVTTGR